MLEYIKQQLAQKHAENNVVETQVNTTDPMDDAILEYAHLFDDMSELTMEGSNTLRERPILDIPIDEDIELDSLELSITSNRIMDVPSDITAMEHVYEDQKSYNDFYQEQYSAMTKLPRENEEHFVQRVRENADKKYSRYMEYVIQEGLFGNDMLNLNDERVPRYAVVNFGPYKTGDYITKLPVGFEVKNGKININQIHALTIAQNFEIFKYIKEPLRASIATKGVNVSITEIWDVATPKTLILPQFDGSYHVVVEFEIDGLSESAYVGWHIEIEKVRKSKNEPLDLSKVDVAERPFDKYDANSVSKMDLFFKGKTPTVSEYATTIKKIPSRWDNNDDAYFDESTKGMVGAEIAGAIAGSALMGIGISVTTVLSLATWINPVCGILGALFVSGMQGLGWGAVANYDIRNNVDRVMAKTITKEVGNVMKSLAISGDSKSVNNFKKFSKANKHLLKELEYHINSNLREVKIHYSNLSGEFKKNMEEAIKACRSMDVPSERNISTEDLKSYLKTLEKLMESIYRRNDNDTVKEYQEEIITLYDIIQELSHESLIDDEVYQEAIDFGGGDNTDAAPAGNTADVNDPAAGDNVNLGGSTEDATDGTEQPKVDADAKNAAVNDVSDAVAAKVSNDANKEPADLGMDAAPTFDSNPDVKLDLDTDPSSTSSDDVNNLEPDMSNNAADDMGSTDNFNTPDVTGNENDLTSDDTSGTFDTSTEEDKTDMSSDELGGGTMDNIDDMSIDDLLAKGEDKLKGMSIAQLKDFLNDGLGTENDMTTNEYATVLEYDNSIKSRINVGIKRCLGVLNETRVPYDQIKSKFIIESKKLNKVLNQAKDSHDLNDNEKSMINKLNSSLCDLGVNIGNAVNKNKLKNSFVNFANNSKIVGKFVDPNNKVTVEAAMECVTDEYGIILEWTSSNDYISGMTPKRETFERLIKMAKTFKQQCSDVKSSKDMELLRINAFKYGRFLNAEKRMLEKIGKDAHDRAIKKMGEVEYRLKGAKDDTEEQRKLRSAKHNLFFDAWDNWDFRELISSIELLLKHVDDIERERKPSSFGSTIDCIDNIYIKEHEKFLKEFKK